MTDIMYNGNNILYFHGNKMKQLNIPYNINMLLQTNFCRIKFEAIDYTNNILSELNQKYNLIIFGSYNIYVRQNIWFNKVINIDICKISYGILNDKHITYLYKPYLSKARHIFGFSKKGNSINIHYLLNNYKSILTSTKNNQNNFIQFCKFYDIDNSDIQKIIFELI